MPVAQADRRQPRTIEEVGDEGILPRQADERFLGQVLVPEVGVEGPAVVVAVAHFARLVSGQMSSNERRRRGLDAMSKAYGWDVQDGPGDFFGITVDHLFGEIWTREGLAQRDRRLRPWRWYRWGHRQQPR